MKAILSDLPSHARYLTFALRPQSSAADVATVLASLRIQPSAVGGTQTQSCFAITDVTDGFHYAGGLDLTGYEDGTESPTGSLAEDVAIITGQGPGLDVRSF